MELLRKSGKVVISEKQDPDAMKHAYHWEMEETDKGEELFKNT